MGKTNSKPKEEPEQQGEEEPKIRDVIEAKTQDGKVVYVEPRSNYVYNKVSAFNATCIDEHCGAKGSVKQSQDIRTASLQLSQEHNGHAAPKFTISANPALLPPGKRAMARDEINKNKVYAIEAKDTSGRISTGTYPEGPLLLGDDGHIYRKGLALGNYGETANAYQVTCLYNASRGVRCEAAGITHRGDARLDLESTLKHGHGVPAVDISLRM